MAGRFEGRMNEQYMVGDGKVNGREIWREDELLWTRAMHGRGWQGKCWRGVEWGKLVEGIWCVGTIFFVSNSNGIAGDASDERTKKGGKFPRRGVCKGAPCNDLCQHSPCIVALLIGQKLIFCASTINRQSRFNQNWNWNKHWVCASFQLYYISLWSSFRWHIFVHKTRRVLKVWYWFWGLKTI